MMNFYYLGHSLLKDEAFAEKTEEKEGLSLDVLSDQPLSLAANEFIIYLTRKDKKPTDLLGIGVFYVVSPRMKAVLEEFDQGYLEFFPVEVKTTWNKGSLSYFLLHVLKDVDFIDYAHSDLDLVWENGPVFCVRRISLDKEKIGDRQLFRHERLYMNIFVSEEVKAALEAANLSGIKFVDSDSFFED
jgi:hypothetical protein